MVFSHLRWDLVFQRPQHLLIRFARFRRVYYMEEPVFVDQELPYFTITRRQDGFRIVLPHLSTHTSHAERHKLLAKLVDQLIHQEKIKDQTIWYYTPEALPFTDHLAPVAVVYDCMDELSAFQGAPATLLKNEKRLLERADVVFTGGDSLYEAKRSQHKNIHSFPSSIDVEHFGKSRSITEEAPDQAGIPHPRFGFTGVIDERMDIELLAAVADERPDWHLVMIGPVVKIDPASLPQRSNIHY
ncbi:MAG: hypothetical protein M3R08_12135, partial [Bacteroidota bacterium]|nr:hypothetical protein [Bacteroidota bacterium]